MKSGHSNLIMRKRLAEYRQGQLREEENEYEADYDDEHEHEHERAV